MRCESVRKMISAGKTGGRVDGHLASCRDCRAWAAALSVVREQAAALVGAAPAGLAARILKAVDESKERAVEESREVSPVPRRRGIVRWWPIAAPAAAALVAGAVVAGVVRSRPPSEEESRKILVAAAQALREGKARTFRFTIEGSSHVKVTPPALPTPPVEFPAVTPPVAFDIEQCASLDEPARSSCEQQAERFRQEMDRLRQELERAKAGPPTFPPPETLVPREFTVRYEGEGVGVGPDRTQATVDYTFDKPVAASGTIEVISVGNRTYIRTTETGGWVRISGGGGFRFGELSGPEELDRLLDVVERPGEDIEYLGESTIDGVRVRGFRIGGEDGTSEVWVGLDDGLLRKVTFTSSSSDQYASHTSRTTIRFYDYGADVSVEEPADAVPIEQLPADRRPPFNVNPAEASA